jgi:hypothetical protein
MLKSSDKSDQAHNNDKLGIVSSTKSDNNEFNDKENAAKPIAALVSFPGSGNTWLRYLLQQATGILTGSVYKDYGLLKSGFPADCEDARVGHTRLGAIWKSCAARQGSGKSDFGGV